MAPAPLLILGAGGFGREVVDVVDAVNRAHDEAPWQLVGFLDDGSPATDLLDRLGVPLLGGREVLDQHAGAWYVVGVAAAGPRRALSAAADAAGLHAATLVHPSATLGRDTTLGEGSILCAHTDVTTHVTVGRHVHVDRQVTVGHDSVLGDLVTLHPGATISGAVTLGEGCTVGSNAVVIQGRTVGAGAFVGAGAAVVRDVEPGVTVVGVPARPLTR